MSAVLFSCSHEKPLVLLWQDQRFWNMPGLSLDTAGGIALGQVLHLCHGHQVEVVLDAVLEAGGGYREIDGVLRGLSVQHGIDEARAEGVATADAVNDFNPILFGQAPPCFL